MSPQRTRKRGLISADVLKAASEEVLKGGLSVRRVAKDYKVCMGEMFCRVGFVV